MRNGIIGLAAAAAFVLVSGLAFAQDKDLPAGGASTKDTTTTTYTAGGISQGALAGGTLAAIAIAAGLVATTNGSSGAPGATGTATSTSVR
jgi:hypothetical protein